MKRKLPDKGIVTSISINGEIVWTGEYKFNKGDRVTIGDILDSLDRRNISVNINKGDTGKVEHV